jgi:NRAMP (natural resistance-associated macrophage protein)-like metal ion transporter
MEEEKLPKRPKKNFLKFLSLLGPGLTTGAADDDPSGIATYSQTGAQFGYGQLWTALFMLPFMTAVQEACARIGLVTGKGISAVVKQHYSKTVLYSVVSLVVVANTINIGADIGAMAAAAQLLVPAPFILLTLAFTIIILLLEIFTNYRTYSKILKWLAITLLAYPITLFIVHQPWATVLKATVVPHFEFTFAFLFIITGVLGTTISPYMFFWEASQEVEE